VSRKDAAPAAIAYTPDGETLLRFMRSNAFGRMLRGPVGSGKSVAGCIEIIRRASEQAPSKINGKRKTRFAVVRNTFPELKTTTMKTWRDWFPEETWGPILMTAPYTHRIQVGDIDCEVIFLALDKPEDVSKLLSLELTGAWVNEGREVPKEIFDGLSMRVGRYPSMRDGGPTWFGWWSDTNPPDEDHWWPIMEGIVQPPDWMSESDRMALVQPKGWEFFAQPAGMLPDMDVAGNITGWRLNPTAENRANLHPDYYTNLVQGKRAGWVKVYVGNQIGGIEHDLAVYGSAWVTETHVASRPLVPMPNAPLEFGWDFGLTPAAVLGQRTASGRLLILKEIVRVEMGAERFCTEVWEALRQDGRFDPWLAELAPEHLSVPTVWGDPHGDDRSQADEKTAFQILSKNGFKVRPAPTNDPGLRIDGVDAMLRAMIEGHPALLVDPSCRMLIRGFEGKYQYEQTRSQSKDGEHKSTPKKDRYSHVHDALQYLVAGGGETARMLAGRRRGEEVKKRPKPEPTKSPIARQRERRRSFVGRRSR
jgi:hypothetical protein